MGDKKVPPPSLGSIHKATTRPPVGAGRLESLNPNRDMTKAAPSFKPNIVPRVKKEPKGDDLDSKIKGPMGALLDESTFQQNRMNAQRFRPKAPVGRGTEVKPVLKSPFVSASVGGFKKDEFSDGMDIDSAPVKKHELEIDSSNPNHPSVLPFVDPQRQKELESLKAKDKEEAMIMSEIKHEIAQLDKEEEKTGSEVLISTLDIPTPLTFNGEFLNEDNLFFIQLPSSLPFTPPRPDPNANNNTNTNTNNTNTNNNANNNNNTNNNANTNPAAAGPKGPPPAPRNPNEFTNTLRGVNGHLGKIVVYKSGKVKLRIGDILYDLTAANNPNFLEELMVLDGSSCYRVGPMSQHLIVTPDIEDLLEKADKV